MDPSTAPSRPRPAVQRGQSGVAFDAIELWVGDLERTRRTLEAAFGFEASGTTPAGPDEEAVSLACGAAKFILRQGTTRQSSVARHVARHGDTAADVALVSGDADSIAERAVAFGLDVQATAEGARIDVTGDGTICHHLRARPTERAPVVGAGPLATLGVDHAAYCLAHGTAPQVSAAYESVFGLERVDVGAVAQVGDARTGMRSMALRSPGGFTVVLTEPAGAASRGQTQRFIDAHAGPGVQHVALAYDDLCRAVEALRARGVAFLRAPDGYYAQSRERITDRPVPWEALERLEILVDADDDGLLLQLFTRPLTARGTFFVELIQRSGASGFGPNNVRALYAAVQGTIEEGKGR